jgi:hypothetical protein
MTERRRDDRRPATTRGIIKYGPAGQEVVCAVDDLTARGAGLRVGTAFGLPQVFRLTIDGESIARHCRVIWVDGKKLGVSFE